MRPWAEHLQAEGFRVSVPRLPGHGTRWQELNTTRWTDWYAAIEREFLTLRAECRQVFVCALSMGGSLALRLAEQYGDDISGLALVNPSVTSEDKRMRAVPVLKRLRASTAGISSDIAKPGVDECGYDRTPLHAVDSLRELWRVVAADLPAVDQPLLLFRSVQDHVVDPSSAKLILSEISSSDRSERLLQRSFHVATLDFEAGDIFAESTTFIRRLISKD